MKKILVIILLSIFVVSCQDTKVLEEKVNKISDDQALILNKLNDINKKVAELKLSPPPSNNKNDKKKPPQSDPNKVYNIAEAGSVVLGNPNASVTIIKWTDYQWPYCAKSVSLVDDILEKYPNDVKVVIKNFPLSFHKQARRAAQYALAADRQGKFKEMYHAIMNDFRKLKENEIKEWKLKENEIKRMDKN